MPDAPPPAAPPIGDRQAGKKAAVERMFDTIAPRYDLLNKVLSFGIDRLWRRLAVNALRADAPRRVLDVATGTADLALEALRLGPDHVVGVDLSEAMLKVGRAKVAARGEAARVTLRQGDAERLPFDDGVFDAALVAFGVRNFEDLDAGLREIGRVLRPGAPLVVLEFSQPRNAVVRWLYGIYSTHVLPRVGGALSKDRAAYEYLPASAAVFPDGERFLTRLRAAGFDRTEERRLTFGVASLYKGYKA